MERAQGSDKMTDSNVRDRESPFLGRREILMWQSLPKILSVGGQNQHPHLIATINRKAISINVRNERNCKKLLNQYNTLMHFACIDFCCRSTLLHRCTNVRSNGKNNLDFNLNKFYWSICEAKLRVTSASNAISGVRTKWKIHFALIYRCCQF